MMWQETSSKVCPRCGETKPLNQFYADSSRFDGRRTQCKKCDLAIGMNKGAQRRRVFGPVPPDHSCPICERVAPRWDLDHDHDTGVIRDYVCRGCNVNMDRFVGKHPRAEATARYLALHGSTH